MDTWQPVGTYPDRIVGERDSDSIARFCIFEGKAFVGVLGGGGYSQWGRRTFARTQQFLTVIVNGNIAIDASYEYDGRSGWTVFPLNLAPFLAPDAIRAVEIEKDGKLLFSQLVPDRPLATKNRPGIRRINAKGTLVGSIGGTDTDLPIEIRVNDKIEWALTSPPITPGAHRNFEFDFAQYCDGPFPVRISVRNATTSSEGYCSPVCAFASNGQHFLFANPQLSRRSLRATLLSWKDGKRRSLTLARREGKAFGAVCRVDQEDSQDFRFDQGRNSFHASLDFLSGEVFVLDDDGSAVGRLPSIKQVLDLLPPPRTQGLGSIGRGTSSTRGVPHSTDKVLDEILAKVKGHLIAGDHKAARDCLFAAIKRTASVEEIEYLLQSLNTDT
jgi:hypothetical protein